MKTVLIILAVSILLALVSLVVYGLCRASQSAKIMEDIMNKTHEDM